MQPEHQQAGLDEAQLGHHEGHRRQRVDPGQQRVHLAGEVELQQQQRAQTVHEVPDQEQHRAEAGRHVLSPMSHPATSPAPTACFVVLSRSLPPARHILRARPGRALQGGIPMRRAVLLVVAACAPAALLAQTSPFVPETLYRDLANEISGDRAFETIRHLTHFHRTGGSRDFFAAAEYIRARRGGGRAGGRQAGAAERRASPAGRCQSGEAWLPGEPPTRSWPPTATWPSPSPTTAAPPTSRPSSSTSGAGIADADYEGKDVKGKVVLASGPRRPRTRRRRSGSAARWASCPPRPTGPTSWTRPTRWPGAGCPTRRTTWTAWPRAPPRRSRS